jgi:hypothetical protein
MTADHILKLATFYNSKLDAQPASIILSGFDAICHKQYETLDEAISDIIDALANAGTSVDYLPIQSDSGGFKTEINFNSRPIKNIKIGIAWKKLGNHYRFAAHLLDEHGKRIMNSNALQDPKHKPKYWPEDNKGFTHNPD